MAERATVQMVTQIGKETVAKGTPVAAAIRLPATSFETGIQANVRPFRAAGTKYNSITALGREWVQARITGQAAYGDLAYLLASIMRAPTSAQQGATTAYKHTYDLALSAPDNVVTFSVEQGDPSTYVSGVKAHKWNYGLVSELGIEFARDEVMVSGLMIGREFANLSTTMTAATAIQAVPIQGPEVSVFLDPTLGNIGTTRLTRALRTNWQLSGRFNPLWTLNAAATSWAAEVEAAPELSLSLMMAADAVGMGPLTNLRNGETAFIRIDATSTVLAGVAYPHKLQLDMACKVTGVSDFSDEDGVYAIEWTFAGVPELTDSKPCKIELTNKVVSV